MAVDNNLVQWDVLRKSVVDTNTYVRVDTLSFDKNLTSEKVSQLITGWGYSPELRVVKR